MRFKMKIGIMAPLVIISFLLVTGSCCNARLLEKDPFTAPVDPSAFDPNPNSVANDHVGKDSPWSSSSASGLKDSVNAMNKLSFRPTIQNIKKADELAASIEAQGVLNVMPKSRPSLKVNSVHISERRLSTSSNSPGVGHSNSLGVCHMQMIRHKTETRNVDIIKSHHSNGDDHLQQNERKLRSTPSPGVGN